LAIALELALTGEPIDASRALALGLVNRVVPADRLMDEAMALADLIADNAPLAVRWTKKVLMGATSVGDDEAWALNNKAVGIVFTSADAMEGPVAFAEKRKPRWQGK
jgi:enoyl-CoA hydratase/carnithine racemase